MRLKCNKSKVSRANAKQVRTVAVYFGALPWLLPAREPDPEPLIQSLWLFGKGQ